MALIVRASTLALALGDQNPTEVARAIATACEANRALITHGSARVICSIGMADDLGSALAGRWTDRTDGGGEFALDLPMARYDQVFDPKDLIAKRTVKGNGAYSTRLVSGRVSTDGRTTLVEDHAIGATALGEGLVRRLYNRRGTNEYVSLAHVPLYLGVPTPEGSPGNILIDAAEGRRGLRVESVKLDSTLDGVPAAEVAIVADRPGRTRLWFDLKRGAVPLQALYEFPGGKQFNIERYDDVHQLPSGAWLPYRRTDFNDSKLVTQIAFKDADFGQPPGRESFRLKLPKPEPVIDEVAGVRHAPGDSWDVAKLPPRGAAGSFPIVDRSELVSAPAMPGEQTPWPTSALAVLGVGIALVGVAGFSFWRRRHA